MKLKKIMVITLTAVMALGLVQCGSIGGKSSEKKGTNDKKVVIWAWDDTFNIKAANMAKERYLKDNPGVEVEVVSMAQEDVVQKLNTSLSSGTYDGLPNIVLIEDYKVQNYIKSYPGELKDLKSYINPSDFMDYKLSFMTEGDKVYGVPFDSGVVGLFYRTDYIEQAGYTKEDMEDLTWDKFIEIGKQVKEKTGKAMLTLDPNDLAQLRIMMQSAGGWYVDKAGNVCIDNNKVLRDAVETYKNIYDANIAKSASGWDAYIAAFQKGDVACVANGCWVSSSIQASEDQAGKWAIAPIPRLSNNPNGVNASNSGGSSWYVLDKVGNSDLAADFLSKTFASDKELLNDLVPAINLVSTLKTANKNSNYNAKSEFFGGQEIFKDFAKWSQDIPAVNYGLYTYPLEAIMAEGMQKILAGKDIDQVLKETQAQAEASVR